MNPYEIQRRREAEQERLEYRRARRTAILMVLLLLATASIDNLPI